MGGRQHRLDPPRRMLQMLAAFWLGVINAASLAATTPADLPLQWPSEVPSPADPKATVFSVPQSNIVLDLHGSLHDPQLVLFMAGNQYRVLPELIAAFHAWRRTQADPAYRALALDRVFYATLPPGKLIDAMASGALTLGNLTVAVNPKALWPDVFMTGPRQMARLSARGHIDSYFTYARNRGSVLLVKKGNPKEVRGVADLARTDVRVAISSPEREPASFESYSKTLNAQGGEGLSRQILNKRNTVSPMFVHHRENPQLLADDLADVAPMYLHFATYLQQHMPAIFDFVPLPAEGNHLDSLGAAKILSSPRPLAAQAWLAFLQTDEAATVFARHAFTPADAKERNTLVK